MVRSLMVLMTLALGGCYAASPTTTTTSSTHAQQVSGGTAGLGFTVCGPYDDCDTSCYPGYVCTKYKPDDPDDCEQCELIMCDQGCPKGSACYPGCSGRCSTAPCSEDDMAEEVERECPLTPIGYELECADGYVWNADHTLCVPATGCLFDCQPEF